MTAVLVDELDLAGELAEATFWSRDQWLEVVHDVGAARTRQLLGRSPENPEDWTPDLLRLLAAIDAASP